VDNNEMLEYGADGKKTTYGACMEVRRSFKKLATEIGIYKILDWIEGKLSKK
jgi:hypothetical protein